MNLRLKLPTDVADRLVAEASQRGVAAEDLAVELLNELLAPEDPLETFIGSGASGRGDLGRRHREILREATEGLPAGQL